VFYLLIIKPRRVKKKKAEIWTATMVEPTGVSARIEMRMPDAAQRMAMRTEQIVTLLKVLKRRIADRAGKMTRAEIRSVPTKLMAKTIMTAIVTARIRLYVLALMPVAVAKSSSKVTEKIWW
jgi:phage-related minor tail protein